MKALAPCGPGFAVQDPDGILLVGLIQGFRGTWHPLRKWEKKYQFKIPTDNGKNWRKRITTYQRYYWPVNPHLLKFGMLLAVRILFILVD